MSITHVNKCRGLKKPFHVSSLHLRRVGALGGIVLGSLPPLAGSRSTCTPWGFWELPSALKQLWHATVFAQMLVDEQDVDRRVEVSVPKMGIS